MGNTKTNARYLGLRLFLEGIEVEVIKAEVVGGLNKPCTATISIPATDEAHRLLPRTLVHVFFMESSYAGEVAQSAGYSPDAYTQRQYTKGAWQDISRGSDFRPGYDGTSSDSYGGDPMDNGVRYLNKHDLRQWRLLFAGEVMGYGFNKIGGLRQIVLKCRDFSSYWEQCKMYWGGAKTSTSTYKRAIFAGATQLHRGKSKVDSTDDLLKLLRAKPSALPNLPGLLGGIYALLESATGVYDSRAARKYRGVNDFMSQAELRLKLTRMIAVHQDDDTSATFIQSKAFRRYFRRVTRAVKSTSSFMDLVNLLLQKVYHQFASIPCPPYMKEGLEVKSKVRIPNKVSHANNEELNTLHKQAHNCREMLMGMINTGNAAANTPVDKKVDGSISDFWERGATLQSKDAIDPGFGTEGHNVDSVLYVVKEANGSPIMRVKNHMALTSDPFAQSVIKDPPANVPANASQAKQDTGQGQAVAKFRLAQLKIKEMVVGGAVAIGAFPGSATETKAKESAMTRDNVMVAAELLDQGLALSAKSSGVAYSVVRELLDATMQDRLNMFTMTPDLYMAPPPKCNVLFPEQIQSISFSRNWMRETTRLALHGRTSRGRNKKTMYFSPNSAILHNRGKLDGDTGQNERKTSLDEMVEAMKRGVSFTMGHEKYSGPIPEIVGLGDNDIFSKINKQQMKTADEDVTGAVGSPGDSTYVMKTVENEMAGQARYSPQQHMQRAANYMFFAKRFATRSLRASLRFTPALVAGLPCLVLDPAVQEGRVYKLTKKKGQEVFPPKKDWRKAPNGRLGYANEQAQGTHYVGVIDTIVHTFDARGGAATEIQLVNCREHREAVELFKSPDDESADTEAFKAAAEGDQLPKETGYASATKIYWTSKEAKADKQMWLSPTSVATDPGLTGDRGTDFDMDSARSVNDVPGKADESSWSSYLQAAAGQSHFYNSPQAAEGASAPTRDLNPGERLPHFANNQVLAEGAGYSGSRFVVKPVIKNGKAQYTTIDNAEGDAVTYQVTKVMKITRYKHPVKVDFSFEQTTLPPWMAQVFWPMRIGPSYYQQTFGCGSILDESVATAALGSLKAVQDLVNNESRVDVGFTSKEHNLDNPPPEDTASNYPFLYYQIPWGNGKEKSVVLLPAGLTSQKHTTLGAVDDLAEMYLGLKQAGADIDRFIDLYTERVFATIPDILGNKNDSLTIMARDGRMPVFGATTIGFHGNAYGDLANLKGWLDVADTETKPLAPESLVKASGALKGEKTRTLNPVDARPVDGKLDPRRLRYLRAMQYLRSINKRALGG